jgi:hypothetical protein
MSAKFLGFISVTVGIVIKRINSYFITPLNAGLMGKVSEILFRRSFVSGAKSDIGCAAGSGIYSISASGQVHNFGGARDSLACWCCYLA